MLSQLSRMTHTRIATHELRTSSMCTVEYGMTNEEGQEKAENGGDKAITCWRESQIFRNEHEETIHLGGAAVDRYRADLGLSTFKDGRGIFDWNAFEAAAAVVVVDGFSVGGGVGVTATDGEMPRLIVPVRVTLVDFGVDTMTGLLALAAAEALAKTLDRRGRRAVAGDATEPGCGFVADGSFAVTAEEDFRCCGAGAGFVFVNSEFNLRDKVVRNVSAPGALAAEAGAGAGGGD